ncbi:hypothetical protein JRQ81_011159 [Phrynocephalus forsythii]|uniref:Uncharacterized protein n=1 Tax=Phrynocephalus forsythii TaxID=171643 RepID=A0A9Q0X7N1_9SAUR|nr:hypothetical protein JRQ81_011159 [Phrynocephalus forsythii]
MVSPRECPKDAKERLVRSSEDVAGFSGKMGSSTECPEAAKERLFVPDGVDVAGERSQGRLCCVSHAAQSSSRKDKAIHLESGSLRQETKSQKKLM